MDPDPGGPPPRARPMEAGRSRPRAGPGRVPGVPLCAGADGAGADRPGPERGGRWTCCAGGTPPRRTPRTSTTWPRRCTAPAARPRRAPRSRSSSKRRAPRWRVPTTRTGRSSPTTPTTRVGRPRRSPSRAAKSPAASDVHTLAAYAWALHRSGRFGERRTRSRSSWPSVFSTRPILYHAGVIAAKLGERATAAERLRQSLELNPVSEVAADARLGLERLR